MANQKPKKSGKKDNSQPEPKKDLNETVKAKETKDTKEAKESTTTAAATVGAKESVAASTNPFKGFFARSCFRTKEYQSAQRFLRSQIR